MKAGGSEKSNCSYLLGNLNSYTLLCYVCLGQLCSCLDMASAMSGTSWRLVACLQPSLSDTEFTPPPQSIASSLQQTPWLHNTSSFANSSEYLQDVNRVLKLELSPLHVGLPRFRETYFGRVAGLETVVESVFKDCLGGSNPLFDEEGWTGWPKDANQDDVLSWFADLCEKLAAFAEHHGSKPAYRRRPLAQPNKPIEGSTGERQLDVSFVNDINADKNSQCHWSPHPRRAEKQPVGRQSVQGMA